MAQRFLFGEEKGLIELALIEWRPGFLDFNERATAGTLGEENLRDIEQRINAGDLMNFLADEMNGLVVRYDGDSDSLCRCDVLTLRRAATAILEVAVSTAAATLERTASFTATFAVVTAIPVIAASATLLAVITARWTIVLSCIGLWGALRLVRASCP